jgi:hypothetical protein
MIILANPENSRIFVGFLDRNSVSHGITSVAIEPANVELH